MECTIGGRLGAEPVTQPSLYHMLDCRIHCLRIRAASEPRTFSPSFNRDVHRLACVLYRGFDTDCCEEDSMNIVDILRFFDQLGYKLSALKLLKKKDIIDLLSILFSSEYLDEEETCEVGKVLHWMRNEFDQQHVSEVEMIGSYSPTKLQITVCYEIQCSDESMDLINQSYENHFISDAHHVVPKYQILASHNSSGSGCEANMSVPFIGNSYRAVIDFSCDHVPVHLIDFPVVRSDDRIVVPTDPKIAFEAILNHDKLGSQNILGDVYLVAPDGTEVYVRGGVGILSNKDYWGTKWQCTALANTTQRRCHNKTHHSTKRCSFHRDFSQYPEIIPDLLPNES